MREAVEKILSGSHLAGARLISLLEARQSEGVALLKQLYPHTGAAFIIGITGPPGAGKSTLVDCMITELRLRKKRVGVLAIDPSSPYSGGALLGDRVRMRGHELDDGVFIRSMASRGRMGGIGQSTREAVLVLDAMGHDVILIETVGVGQDEIDVIGVSHATVVVSIPGMGDDIQAMKAGLLEIGDVFVVNKADLAGSEELVRLLEGMLHLRADAVSSWRPPVIQTVALRNEGVAELIDACFDFHRQASASGLLSQRIAGNQTAFLRQLVMELAAEKILKPASSRDRLAELNRAVARREIDPYTAAEKLLATFFR
jgi:LAO/AO transport system kinase